MKWFGRGGSHEHLELLCGGISLGAVLINGPTGKTCWELALEKALLSIQ